MTRAAEMWGHFTGTPSQGSLDPHLPAVEETPYVRHVRFDRPLKIMMDGKKQEGVIER